VGKYNATMIPIDFFAVLYKVIPQGDRKTIFDTRICM